MEIGLVRQIDIDAEMRQSFLSYAMSVIVSRALPDARDGLKPVQRRILYAMHDMGLQPDRPYRKSARVVGEVLGKYHPHGDQAVYDAMVRMAQDFSMRYPLVDGQGNFGSIDGDSAAAMRYTETRMTQFGSDLLQDINRDTVDFSENFDESMTEPTVLPSILPNLLVNGSLGIAVGMSTSIPPHNLREVIDALCYMLDRWEKLDDITVSDLMEYIHGPDFPTGGLVFQRRERKGNEFDALANAYGTGRGRVTVRAKAHVENMERNKSRIVITELPYQTNKTNLLNRIADLHRDGRIEGLTDLRDESDRNGMRIILETTRTRDAREVLEDLFKLTPLQSTFSIILVALVDGEPKVLTLKQALRVYLEHRLEIVRRRSEYDLARARERAHILEGLLIALDNLDEVIDRIRRSRTSETARNNLIRDFKMTEAQAQAVLDMRLRRLAALERRKIQEEYDEKQKEIKFLERLLSREDLMRTTVKDELLAVRERYGDARRTQIIDAVDSQVLTASDLIPDEQVWVLIGQDGTVARTTSPEAITIPLKPDELPGSLLQANTQDILYFFFADGQAASVPVYQLPQARELGIGSHWAELTPLTRRAHLAAAQVVPQGREEGYLLLCTLAGVVKRVRLEDLPGLTGEAFTVIRVEDDDALGWARLTDGTREIMLATAAGQAIRFSEEDVRSMGLPAGGVMGVKLNGDTDGVVACELVEPDTYVWAITDNGLAKATLIEEYPNQNRYGQGVRNVKLPKDAAEVVAMLIVPEDAEIIVTTALDSARKIGVLEGGVGSRAIKPRSVVRIGNRNRVTGAMRWRRRPAPVPAEEPEQLSLLDA